MCFFKRFRCLNAENLGSVGQRAAKLLAVKVGGLKKKSASRPRPQSASLLGFEPGPNGIAHALAGMAEAADFFLRTPTLTASNFAAL